MQQQQQQHKQQQQQHNMLRWLLAVDSLHGATSHETKQQQHDVNSRQRQKAQQKGRRGCFRHF